MQLVAVDLEVGGGVEDLAEQAAGFVVGAGVVRREQAVVAVGFIDPSLTCVRLNDTDRGGD